MSPSRPLRRALFVSGSLGKGHDVVAEACAAALAGCGVETRIVDAMRLLGEGPGAAGDRIFRRMLAHPSVYDAFHFAHLRDGSRLARVADWAAVRRLMRPLEKEVDSWSPELVVAVFATGAAAAARLAAAGRPIRTAVVITDALAHSLWVHPPTDLYLVISAAAAESVRRYWPEARVEVVSAPVRPEFSGAPARSEARRKVGVPADARCVLVISGSWGIGPLDQVAEALARSGCSVLAVAGTNSGLEAKLRAVAGRHREVLVWGYTDQLPALMAASDVVVTSSGDTCREARAIGRPIVLIDVVAGHGRENLQHELELGGSTVCQPTADSVDRAVRSFLADPDRSAVEVPSGPDRSTDQWLAAVRSLGFALRGF